MSLFNSSPIFLLELLPFLQKVSFDSYVRTSYAHVYMGPLGRQSDMVSENERCKAHPCVDSSQFRYWNGSSGEPAGGGGGE